MVTSLKLLKEANANIQSTIFGYMRQHQDALAINIPSMISYLCMAFYFIPEFFEKSQNEEWVQISQNKMTATNIKQLDKYRRHKYNPIFCHQWIISTRNCICIWKFRIEEFGSPCIMQWALVDREYGEIIEPISLTRSYCLGLSNLHRLKQGDIVTIKLDLIAGAFICLLNDGEAARRRMVAKSEGIKYQLAVDLANTNDSVTLLEYHELY